MPLKIEKVDLSPANNFEVDEMSFVRSLIYIMKKKAPKFEPWGTAANTGVHAEVRPFGVYYLEKLELVLVVFQLCPYI